MLDLAKEFSQLGFLEETEEDTVTYVMDFPDDVYVTVTDDNGRTPVRAKQNLVLACYDSEGRYRWGSEFKTFMELQITANRKAVRSLSANPYSCFFIYNAPTGYTSRR